MSLQLLRDSLKDTAKDIRLNLSSVLSEEGAPGLSRSQIMGVALATAFAVKDQRVYEAIRAEAAGVLDDAAIKAAVAAAVIMAQNNVYYRSIHLAEDKDLSSMPAKLRMTVIGNPGIPKVDFEMYCLGVSALAGCGMCIKSHAHELKKAGVSQEGVQSVFRIAAVIAGAVQGVAV